MKKLMVLPMLCCIWVTLAVFASHPGTVRAEQVVLNWASILPKNSPETVAFQEFAINKMNERAKGELVINYRGGPDVIAPQNLAGAVHKGVVDICTVFVGFYEAIVPGIGAAMLTEFTPQEERQPGGTYDFLVKFHQNHGLMYLGRAAPSEENFFFVHLNKKVEKPEDFTKLRLGAGPAGRAAAMAWGAKVIPVRGVGDYYTSMERGLYDGHASCPLITWVALGCHEVTKYCLDHPFYQSTVMAIMNLNSWNRIPKNLQNMMIQVMNEYPALKMEEHTVNLAKARKKAMDAGVEFYKFSPDVAKWFMETTYNAGWDYQEKRFPKETAELKKWLKK